MITAEQLADFAAALRPRIAGELRTDAMTRVLYSTDASLYQVMPHAVLIPRTTEDVIAAVSVAAAHDVPVLPRAAGTSLAGQAVNAALVIDFTRHLDAILAIDPAARRATVQPGVVVDDLNAALRPHGLQFGPDPASSDRSTLGGAVANNATGSHSARYGMTADHVTAMDVVLADGATARLTAGDGGGTAPSGAAAIRAAVAALLADAGNQRAIDAGTPRHWRRCGGYALDRLRPGPAADRAGDLAALVCGSEGTLAVMTAITLNLVPRPAHTGLVLLHIDDLHAALAAVPDILTTDPSAVELLDTLSLALGDNVPEYARLLAAVVPGRPRGLLVVEYSGESEAAVRAGATRLERLAAQLPGIVAATPALSPAHQAAVWAVRKANLGLLMSMKGDMKPVPSIEDAAVPVADLPEYVRRVEEFCAGLDTPISYYAHAGAGCLHIRPLINRRSAAQLARLPEIARFSAAAVRGYGGALSSEHGDGRARSWLNEEFYGPELYALFRRVKRIFDPANRLNPGIIVDAAPMTASLRRLPELPGPARLDFSDYERDTPLPLVVAPRPEPAAVAPGLVRAVELCNGAGVCRRRTGGTMCPSFMVTREEAHSTRGRANALRAVMSGVLPAAELTGPGMAAVMDLCISCKACRAECPSGVDMARLKTEYLARTYEAHGVPLRARLFAHAGALNRWGGGWRAPLAGALLNSRARRWLGLTTARPLPVPARRSFRDWWRDWWRDSPESRAPDLALLIDPFTDAIQPAVGIAAVEFLRAAGLRPRPVVVDDGRACISKGLVGAARRAAARTVAALEWAVAAGLPVVGLEPSSLLTLRDEYLYLLPGDGRAAALAAAARTFEEFVAERAAAGALPVRFAEGPWRMLLHGHCHQKALVGTGPARRALALLPGAVVEEVDSGCCGMAGSFGYEAEHYAISMQMAERRLLPAVRAAGPETIIVAAGFSCREQIAHGSGRRALHPAEVLRAALLP
ncbi:MAG TPA: FAD-linked oxidase C-terminal domain-containing protein [Promineifilum sp.]|nr:FAD-linked oxidase C-terminal domain-containing protein [Promineifilum sp.]